MRSIQTRLLVGTEAFVPTCSWGFEELLTTQRRGQVLIWEDLSPSASEWQEMGESCSRLEFYWLYKYKILNKKFHSVAQMKYCGAKIFFFWVETQSRQLSQFRGHWTPTPVSLWLEPAMAKRTGMALRCNGGHVLFGITRNQRQTLNFSFLLEAS